MSDSHSAWPFLDPPDTAVITSHRILNEEDWIHYVTHNGEDGLWQFLGYSGPTKLEDAAVASLRHLLQIEPRLSELADLPLGWHAWRDDRDSAWKQEVNLADRNDR